MSAIIDDKGNASITCDHCGKPIVESNKYGMFCEDRCGYKRSIMAYHTLTGIIKTFSKIKDS